jgi:hypothetical protein
MRGICKIARPLIPQIQENRMRKFLIPTLVFVAWAAPALAQDAQKQAAPQNAPQQTQKQAVPPDAPQQTQKQAVRQDAPQQTQAPDPSKQKAAPPAVVQNQDDDALVKSTQAIERSVQTRLVLAGYTDVEMIPTAFLVRAKDPSGHSVMMLLGPESLTGANEAVPDQDNSERGASSDSTACGGGPCPGAEEE